jgi:GNAT superfamily N-acetyltransferase
MDSSVGGQVGKLHGGEGYVELRTGDRVRVRPVTPADRRLLLAGFARFGDRSRQQRFFGVKVRLTEAELAFFTEVDHHDHEALGAIDVETGAGVGIARFVRLEPGGPVAEAAVAVVDDWQSRGVGRALLEALVDRAHEEGVERFQATLMRSNRAMLEAFRRIGAVEVTRRELDALEICIELPVSEMRRVVVAPDRPAVRSDDDL